MNIRTADVGIRPAGRKPKPDNEGVSEGLLIEGPIGVICRSRQSF